MNIDSRRIIFLAVLILLMLLNGLNVVLSATVVSTHPANSAADVPAYMPLSVRLDQPVNPSAVSVTLNPWVSGDLDYAQCDILSYYYTDGNNLVYRPLEPCYRVVFTPSGYLMPGTAYAASISGGGITPYSWFLTTGFLNPAGEHAVKSYSYPSSHRPAVGINRYGDYVVVWQDRNEGIRAQRYDSSSVPVGAEISIASGAYYSEYSAPTVAMNDNGEFVVGWMDTFSTAYPALSIRYYVRKFSSSGIYGGGWDISSPLASYVFNNPDFYKMQFYNNQFAFGGPSVGIDTSGRYIIVYAAPSCFDRGDVTKVPKYQCDTVVFGALSESGSTSLRWVGDTDQTYIGGNVWSGVYDTPIINDPPWLHSDYTGGDYSRGCGGQGSAYDCPYHPSVYMAPDGKFIVTWLEFNGNLPNAFRDDVAARIFDSNGNPVTNEFQVNTSLS